MAAEILLKINGRMYNVLRYDYEFHRQLDCKGRPAVGAQGGNIHIVMESGEDTSILEEMLSERLRKVQCPPAMHEYELYPISGKVQVINEDMQICRELIFDEGYIYNYCEKMIAEGSEPMRTFFSISVTRLDIDKYIRIDRRIATTYGFGWEKYKEVEKKTIVSKPSKPTSLVTSVRQQNKVVQTDQSIVPQVEKIGITSALVEGFGGEGMIYGKTYELKVLKFVADKKPDDKNSIRWGYSDKTNIDEEAIELEQTGETIKFKVDNYELLGKELTFFAYIGNKKYMASEKYRVHNRFRWFNEQKVEQQLEGRRKNPQTIEQAFTSLCGVAAVAYLLAKDYPSLFTNKFMEFLRTGETQINNFKVKPNPSLYEMKPGDTEMKYPRSERDGTMKEADWLVLAGIRSSDNHSYEGKEGEDFDAINWPSFMKKIVKDMYGAEVVEDKTSLQGAMAGLFSDPHHQELRTIQQEFERGYDFIFMIDADMLSNTVSSVGCINQYHWIVYQGELKIDEAKKECEFKYYSWGRLNWGKYNRGNDKIPLSFDAFDSNFYGYIKCKRAEFIDSPVKIKSPDGVKSIKENESYA